MIDTRPGVDILLPLLLSSMALGCGSGSSASNEPDAAVDGDTDADTDTETDSDTDSDTYTADYFGNGTLDWVTGFGGPGPDTSSDFSVLDDGSAILIVNGKGDTIFGIGGEEQVVIEERGLSLARVGPEGQLAWARSLSAAEWVSAASIDVSADGHIYLAGAINDPTVFGAGEAEEVELISAGEADGFVASFDMEGSLEWIRQLGGSLEDIGWAVEAASGGDLIFLGSYTGEAALDDGTGGQLALAGEEGVRTLLLASYSSAGDLLWTKTGAPLGDHIYDDVIEIPRLSLADDDSVFVVFARPDGEVVLAGGEADEVAVPAPEDGRKGVLARFAPDGTAQWGRALSGLNAYFGLSLAALPDGSAVFVVSETSGDGVAGLGDPNETLLSCGANYDCAVLARYDGTGALDWALSLESDRWTNLLDVAIGADDSVVVTGVFDGLMEVETTSGAPRQLETRGIFEILIAKYGLDGVLRWAEQAGSASECWVEDGRAARTDSSGAVYAIGLYSEPTWFGILEPGQTILEPAVEATWDELDVFMARYEP